MAFTRVHTINFMSLMKHVDGLRRRIINNEKKKITLKWIRSTMTIYYLYLLYYGLCKMDFSQITHPSWKNLKDNWWKCITVWNLVLQGRYFVMSFAIDHADTIPLTSTVRKFIKRSKRVQDFCFVTFDAPSSVWVCTFFWLLQLLNKPLFYPAEMKTWVPEWLNHAAHTNPFFLTFFLMFFEYHENPPVSLAVCGLFGLCGIYVTCVLYTRWSTGQWIYIIIEEVIDNIPLTVTLLLITGFIFPLFILLACYKLNYFIWNEKYNKRC